MIEKLKYDNHEEWLALRHKYIGGSDAGAVVGMNPYKSRYSLWAEKRDMTPAFEGNITTKVGAYLEELVAKMFEDESGKKVQRVNFSFHNTDYPYAIANIDRKVVGENALLEIKTTTSIPIMKQLRKSDFPEAYYAQCVHYLAVTGLEKAYLAVLVNCRELKIYELERDQAEIDALMSAEKEFWNLVETGVAPGVDGTDATKDTLLALYPDSTDTEMDLTAFNRNLDEYVSLSNQIKALTELKDQIANSIKEYMKNAGKGYSGKYSVSYKTQSRRTFDTKKFEADHKNISLEGYFDESKSRVFKVTEKGE